MCIYVYMHVIRKRGHMNLKENKEGFMGGFGGSKEMTGEM